MTCKYQRQTGAPITSPWKLFTSALTVGNAAHFCIVCLSGRKEAFLDCEESIHDIVCVYKNGSIFFKSQYVQSSINCLICLCPQVIRGVPLGVGQIFACGALGPSFLIMGAVLLYSPLLAAHALLGSAVGALAGEP